ncbi:aminopeptidase [Mycolicibacterium sp. P9-64]|uniref:aminopeptidase n=1 Tax=Mycolicibacterium sp. P9-64 TaxID=2024612 RepID=UPI0011ED4B58|nr:aminopeptidase [Mycolicibacterium sp. P9-64]KAA0087046.1 aminopeptidase [Mycolicibacterium sp. P9-64]
MTVRRLVLVVGAVLLVAGVIGLLMPVSISSSDGPDIGCGNAMAADTSNAQAANDKNVVADIPIINQIVPHRDYVSECNSAISSRRTWTIPLTIFGAVVVAASFMIRGSRTVGADTP